MVMKFTLILLLSHPSLVFAGIVSEIAGFVQNGITLSQNAISHHGGTFTDLFGADQSNIASVPSDSDEFVDVDLRMDNFLITGIDPFFDASRDVFFVLYTNENNEGEIFSIENVGNTTFNKSNPVRVIIHGLNNNYTSPMSQTVMKAYLEEGDYNVIVTDWSLGANDRFYLHSRLRVDSVSGQVAGIINSLIARNFTTYDQVVIVGHSLGGQTAGLTGKKIVGGKVSAVIALDPAGPLFPPVPSKCGLSPEDAQYVEIVHCNGGGLGLFGPCGQADFFPNGGSFQEGCNDILQCSHSRCYYLFAESITNNNFVSEKCASLAEILVGKCTDQGGHYLMGGPNPNSGNNGVFYLKTAGSSPYALG